MNACVTEQITVNGAKRLVMLMYTGILRQEKKILCNLCINLDV